MFSFNRHQTKVGYGMTEASPLITTSDRFDTYENRTETIGKALEHNNLS